MAQMPERQRAAARLRHVADQNAFPTGRLGGGRREFLQEFDQFRMAPVAIARQPHHLPVRPVDRQLDAALQTAARVVADGHGLAEARQLGRREQRLGRHLVFADGGFRGRHRRRHGDGSLRKAADGERAGESQRQSQHGDETGVHDVSGLAIPPPPVSLNARDYLNKAAEFPRRAAAKKRVKPRAFMIRFRRNMHRR